MVIYLDNMYGRPAGLGQCSYVVAQQHLLHNDGVLFASASVLLASASVLLASASVLLLVLLSCWLVLLWVDRRSKGVLMMSIF